MSSKVPTPVSGGDEGKGAADGVDQPEGRGGAGESGGGNYRAQMNGDDDGKPPLGYHGGDHAGAETTDSPNDMVRDGGDWEPTGKIGPKPGPTGPEQHSAAEYARDVRIGGHRIELIETSGIAAAEASGMVGKEGEHATDGEHPGSG